MATDKFWGRVIATGVCWYWSGHLKRDGYGLAYDGIKTRQAHRMAYELLIGPIPDGLVLDHLCRVKRCVNPDHLEPVTNAENIRRGQLAMGRGVGATHCPQGHAYDDENTYTDRNGYRYCRTCQRQQTREWRDRQRGGPARPYGDAVSHCPQGHPYDEQNTKHRPDGRRRCRACDRAYQRRKREEARA